MNIFSKKIGPVFLKETSDAQFFVEKMQALQEKSTGEVKQKIEKQINLAKYGEIGESNIAFELKNSGMDMYVLHDIYLETGNLSAQIDYIVITRQCVYVIECKNLIGNIEIDNTGAFIRSYELGGKRIKEGIYSPITQNQRHLQVLKEVRKSGKTNFITKMIFEKNFGDVYKSVVVLANPKTYLNAKFAKKEIKDQVIRADQLVEYIKKANAKAAEKNSNTSVEEMLQLAKFFLEKNNPNRSDYARKYEEMVAMMTSNEPVKEALEESQEVKSEVTSRVEQEVKGVQEEKSSAKEEVISKLKAFRLEQSRKENVKPYYIFNDAQMMDLLEKNPKTKAELLNVSGFGNVKVEKYGDAILQILHD